MAATPLANPLRCSRARTNLRSDDDSRTLVGQNRFDNKRSARYMVSEAGAMVMNKLVLTGLTHPGAFELEPGFNTLGRNPTNDFRVHDVTVSSFHCEIVVSEDSVLVRDLGSTNGTYIDGQPVQEAQLTSGQILRLGSAELRLESTPVTEPAHIAIPEVKFERPPSPETLADGSLSSLNHRHVGTIVRTAK